MKVKIAAFVLCCLATFSTFLTHGPVAAAQIRALENSYPEAKIVPQRFVVSSDGTLIAVSEQGPRDGRTLLLIHGFANSGAVFYNQLSSPLLLPFNIVTMDLRGHGYSEKPTDPAAYTNHDLYADDVHAVIRGLHLNKPVLAGWSFGSIPVFDYLQKYGQSDLSGVSLIDPIACPDVGCTAAILQINGAVPAYFDLVSPEAAKNFSGAEEFVKAESAGAANKQQTLILRTIITQTPPSVLASIFGIQYLGYADVMSSLTVPVLIQYGSNDPLIDLNSISKDQALIKNQVTRVYPDGAHIPFILNAEQFNADLAEWLARI